MMHLMDQISDKPGWEREIFDESVALKWKEEALAVDGMDISEAMVDWCIEELRYKTKILEATKAISIYNADVVKSDTIIPESLKLALKAAAASLEDTLAGKKGWHLGLDDQILDLVDPFLFPLVYGRTRILPNASASLNNCVKRCGEGEVSTTPAIPTLDGIYNVSFSQRFQWLPCDVDISTGHAKITSYINNLHPQEHKDLYHVIEEIISRSIPLWNMTLTPFKAPNIRRIAHIPEDGPHRGEDENDYDYNERWEEWIREICAAVQPEPKAFQPSAVLEYWKSKYDGTPPGPCKTVDLYRDFCEKGLQVIVKLTNIHLTPEDPRYTGGSWRVEGQLNEHICAMAFYYYDSHNITPSRLALRQQSNINYIPVPQWESPDWFWKVFGCDNEGSWIQYVGAVETKEGRLITFPNILQHKVRPFQLADPTKPGHRKILALFLVDPTIKIISTANVPCQRRDWWRECIETNGNPLGRLPVEVQDLIFDLVDLPLSSEEATSLRLDFMEERRQYIADLREAFRPRGNPFL